MKQTIELIILPTGETRLETKGYAGAECVAASKFLERGLGRRLSERKSSEYHQVSTNRQNSVQRET